MRRNLDQDQDLGGEDWSPLTKDRVMEIIQEEVVSLFQECLPKMFASIKTATVEYFDER